MILETPWADRYLFRGHESDSLVVCWRFGMFVSVAVGQMLAWPCNPGSLDLITSSDAWVPTGVYLER
jgi:hypothetical protein